MYGGRLLVAGLAVILLMLVLEQRSLSTIFGSNSEPEPSAPEQERSSRDSFHQKIGGYFDSLPNNHNQQLQHQHQHHQQQQDQEVHWIRDYLHWHHEMRSKFPEQEIFDHPNAPDVTIAFHNQDADKAGGLTDRMKSVGHILQRASSQRRVLLFKWYNGPLPLEAFVVPHLLNFTVPYHDTTDTLGRLKESYGGNNRKKKTTNNNNNPKVSLEHFQKGQHNANFLEPYGVIWRALFHPSTPVKRTIDTTMTSLGLKPGQFDAVHCRVSHPAFSNQLKYDAAKARAEDTENDYQLFPETGNDNTSGRRRRQVEVIQAAIHGIQCAEWIAHRNGYPTYHQSSHRLYFYADSPDLVRTVVAPGSLQVGNGEQPFEGLSSLVDKLTDIGSSKVKIVGRVNASIAHMANRRNHTAPEAFLSTFVDLYIAAQARCISLGVGRFAYMAGKISGTSCWTRHQATRNDVARKWGMNVMMWEVPVCNLSTTT